MNISNKFSRLPLLAGALLFLAACSSTPTTQVYSVPEGDWKARITSQEKDGIKVSAAVPSAKESREIFGESLYKKGIQPVWLEISNNRETRVSFLPVGLDPQYFTPLEVANTDLKDINKASPESLVNEFFLNQGIGALAVNPGQTRSGFIFSKLDEGTKAFNVDIIGDADASGVADFETFTFFIPVPGLNIDHYNVDWESLYSDDEWVDLDRGQLIEIVEQITCCVTDAKGQGSGDPLNLVVIGYPIEIYTAFIRAGWDETETVNKASTLKTIGSFLSGGEYRYSPISGLYVFGRAQDVAFQKARENIHERNHLRLWMSRARFEGVPVFMGQISRDIGVRFTTKTITTHKIDPNVDETREYLLENLAYSQSLKKFAYVGGVGEVPMEAPKGNLTGDPWFTDGYRIVLWVSSEPVSIDDVDFVEWRMPH
ncbi:LssY C-terminal domain-containing protein [Pseudomonadota bacterium]